jgi:capsular exopolysaccharide synthesis family protein
MSRIHDALKKAEQERATVPATDVAPPVTTTAMWTQRAAEVTADVATPSSAVATMAAPQTDYLRFDDLREHCAHPHWQIPSGASVFIDPNVSPHGAEQFRTLRSRLYQMRGNQPLRALLVTSAAPAEGKTFVTSNLAQAIVRQPDRRALIIDADLRRARLHLQLGAPAAPGLTDYLRGEADELAVIQHGQEGNLCFIPGGNEVTNPSELLSNGRLKKLLDRVTPVFDWVILDSPPCLAVADANILADFCDGILLVVRAGVTPAEVAQKACQELQGRNVVGVVLNAVEEAYSYGRQYYDAYGYGRNGSKDSQN